MMNLNIMIYIQTEEIWDSCCQSRYVASRDQIRIFETPSFLISTLSKIITPLTYGGPIKKYAQTTPSEDGVS
jgi:hypothetical protein